MSTEQTPEPAGKILFSAAEIAKRVGALGKEISSDYADRELLAIIILRGGFIFGSDLLRQLDPTISLHLDFLGVSSYDRGRVSTGTVRITKDTEITITDRNVLIIEDIVDTGRTVGTIRAHLSQQHPNSIRIATLLAKKRAHERSVQLDYVGFEVPDAFVVGYGLDYAQYYRPLADIGNLDE